MGATKGDDQVSEKDMETYDLTEVREDLARLRGLLSPFATSSFAPDMTMTHRRLLLAVPDLVARIEWLEKTVKDLEENCE